jgi:CubicO group peptidase (beta-lactamase class C family)
LKSVLKWIAIAVLVAAVLVIAKDPQYWHRRTIMALHGGSELPQSFYSPRATIRGGNQPPAPRESPAVEQLDITSIQAAADYAERHQSRALIVTRHGYIVFEKYWQGSNLDTMIESPGLGRVVAALTTGVAISERKIGWPDEPLGYLIPAWNKDPRGGITVRNLLQHGADPDVLAYTIQHATGQPYAEYVSQAIWRRIGAGDASIWLDRTGADPHADAGFFARQGDWLRVAELILHQGNYQGDEVIAPRWVPELLKPVNTNLKYASYLHRGTDTAPGMSPYATDDVLVVEGGGNQMWLVPSLQMAILRTGSGLPSDWDEGRIPNLIIRGAHDFIPPAARPGADLRQLVPNH